MSIQDQVLALRGELAALNQRLSSAADFIAVTKYATLEQTQALIDAGCQRLGENRVQSAEEKIAYFEKHPDLEWHLIGHLQKNKVKKAVSLFSWIQSIDSMPLLEKISNEASLQNREIQGLLQINIGSDPAKHGFDPDEFCEKMASFQNFQNVNLRGIMTILPLDDDKERQRAWFKQARSIFDSYRHINPQADTLSMGMTNDYIEAIEEGSTMIRIGRRLITED